MTNELTVLQVNLLQRLVGQAKIDGMKAILKAIKLGDTAKVAKLEEDQKDYNAVGSWLALQEVDAKDRAKTVTEEILNKTSPAPKKS